MLILHPICHARTAESGWTPPRSCPLTAPGHKRHFVPLSTHTRLDSVQRRMFVAMMFVVCIFNFADRAVFAVLAQSIKLDLRLSDTDLGILQGLSFAFLYAVMGIPIGRLAEWASRVKIIASALAIWSMMTIVSGMAQSFLQLMLSRVGVGIGEAGFTPPMSSLVSDHFPSTRRTSMIALIMLGAPTGLLVGSLAGGWIAAHWQWRTALFALGIPGFLVALLLVAALREPSRGLTDGPSPLTAPPPDFRAFLKVLVFKRSLRWIVLGGALSGFGTTAISQFMAVFLARSHHMSVREAGTAYGIISALTLAIGLLAGSFGAEWLSRRDARWPAWCAAAALGCAPFLYFFALTAGDRFASELLLAVSGSALMIFYGPTLGMIQNLLEPRMRATGAAVFGMLYTLIGSGLGPTFVGIVSDMFARTRFPAGEFASRCHSGRTAAAAPIAQACASASAYGIRCALELAVSAFFLASLSYVVASRSLRQDLYRREA
jgi:MFS family permease